MHGAMTDSNEILQAANVIYVDVPAGVGFSYAKTWEATKSGDSILASHIYDFVREVRNIYSLLVLVIVVYILFNTIRDQMYVRLLYQSYHHDLLNLVTNNCSLSKSS